MERASRKDASTRLPSPKIIRDFTNNKPHIEFHKNITVAMSAPSAMSRVLAITELREAIFDQVDACHHHKGLFVLQGVNKFFRDAIRNSHHVQTSMGLRHSEIDAVSRSPQAISLIYGRIYHPELSGIRGLDTGLKISPFKLSSNQDGEGWYHGGHLMTKSATICDGDPRGVYEMSLDLEVIDEYADALREWCGLGHQGKSRLYNSKGHSWRSIKLIRREQPAKIVVSVQFRDKRARYQDIVHLASEQATLGTLIDVLEEVMARSESEHKKLSDVSMLMPRYFGGPGHTDLCGFEAKEDDCATNMEDGGLALGQGVEEAMLTSVKKDVGPTCNGDDVHARDLPKQLDERSCADTGRQSEADMLAALERFPTLLPKTLSWLRRHAQPLMYGV